jgi:mono/diheme cytochrome c family protein
MTPRDLLRAGLAAASGLVLAQGAVAFTATREANPATPAAATAAPQAPAQAPAAPDTSARGDAASGKKLFNAKGCIACHKADGSGGIKLTGNPTPDWRNAQRMSDVKYGNAYLRDCITNGKPASGMVPWKAQLKPEQIEDLIAHIRTFSEKKAKKG